MYAVDRLYYAKFYDIMYIKAVESAFPFHSLYFEYTEFYCFSVNKCRVSQPASPTNAGYTLPVSVPLQSTKE